MRRSLPLFFALILGALPAFAGERHQSYVSYQTGDVVILQQEDGREMDARLNVPVYPGDEVRTQRRGRLEIRLSDGNLIAIDRGSVVRFASILDSYDGESEGTVAQLRSGEVIIQRLASDSSPLRLDTDVASYIATKDAVYGVETGGRGQDTISVYDGTVEVRSARRTSRLRSGDRATVDSDGIGAVLTISRYGMSDFQDWILHRWERTSRDSRYLDSRLSYADADLDYYGGWVYVNSYNSWAWRPRVSVGWQPYHYGSWSYGPSGSLVWVSDEPWGWVPYHYGRWTWAGGYGWVWVPGITYSPAWVYWAFGPSYMGWVPAGWYDCWGPYYNWAYRPYANVHSNIGFGFYGRAHLGRVDLNHWTFVDPGTVMSNRRDRTSLTTDEIRNRLARNGDAATVTGGAIRLGRNEWKDPVSAAGKISRRGIGSGTGKEGSGATADLTPYFRRDPELPSNVRNHVERIAGGGSTAAPSIPQRGGTSATPSISAPRDPGGIVRRGRADDTPDAGGRVATPRTNAPDSGRVSRPGDSGRTDVTPRVVPDSPRIAPRDANPGGDVERPNLGNRDRDSGTSQDWRSRGGDRAVTPAVPRIAPRDSSSTDRQRPATGTRNQDSNSSKTGRARPVDRGDTPASNPPVQSAPQSQSWRGRGGSNETSANRTAPARESGTRSSDIPRRIIDQIGGARVVPSGGSKSSGGSVNRDRGSSSTPRPTSVDRPAPPPRQPESRPAKSSSDGGRAKIKPQ